MLTSRGASRHARRRPTMRDALSRRSRGGAPEPPPTPPGPPPTITPADPAAPDSTDAPGDDSSRPSPRSSRPTSSKPPLNNLHGSPSTENRHSSENPGIARKTHNRPAAPSSSNMQYPARPEKNLAPPGSGPPAGPAAPAAPRSAPDSRPSARRPPRIVRNGALGGSFRPAPGDLLD